MEAEANESFGGWLGVQLAERGYSQAQLSRLMTKRGLRASPTTINKWLNADRPASRANVTALLDLFGVNDPAERERIRGLAAKQPRAA